MAIRFNWRLPSTGEELAKISVTFTLSREDLANVLAAAKVPHDYDKLKDLSKAEIESAVRDLLSRNPDQRNWWTDDYREDYDGEPTADDVFEWAKSQINRL